MVQVLEGELNRVASLSAELLNPTKSQSIADDEPAGTSSLP
jgi:hypothetical protein